MKTPALRVALASAFLLVFAVGCGEEPAVCGDGVLAATEECDDGNTNANDACVQCRDATCGDGQVLTGVEACDDGNTDETDACRFDCTLASCGDGIKQEGEACDGASLGGETCESNGFGGGTLTCLENCTGFVTSGCCGDGVIGAEELCDGAAVGAATCGDQSLGDGVLLCNATCNGYDVAGCCGDGTVGTGETCDGAALNDATCEGEGLGAGALACNTTCNGFNTAACCGDGTVGGDELCDGADLASATCESRGFQSGTLSCSATCDALVENACCGDGNVGGTELCDGTAFNGATCQSLGYYSGNLSCSSSCGLQTAGCCGDGVRAATELCDGADLNGVTCVDQGFRGGQLACGACGSYRTGACCGDGTVGGDEQCDDGNALDGDGCENSCTLTAGSLQNVTVCRNLVPLPNEVCAVTVGSGAKLITGNILLPNEVLRGGQVAVDAAGQITCVGCDCGAQDPAATQITCPQGVVTPGLINAHDHITYANEFPQPTTERYEHRHDWRRGLRGHTEIFTSGGATTAQVQWGELRYLLGGATSVIGSGSAPGWLRNLDRSNALEGLNQPAVLYQTFPLGDTSGQLRDGNCDYGTPHTEATIATAAAYFPHIGEGIDREARNEFFCTAFSDFDTTPVGSGPQGLSHDLMEAKTAVIHAVGFKPTDFGEMGVQGSSMIWSPRSNISLYGDTAQVSVADRMGVNIALGTDWMPSGSMNMLRELRCADDWNRERLGGHFTDQQLWRMVTLNAARAAQMDDAIGVLAVGLVADIAIFDGRVRADHRAILGGEPSDVTLVLRGGKPLTGDAQVISALPNSGSCDLLDVCGVDKRVCAQSEVGSSLSALQTAAGNVYGAAICGTPPNEPTCSPSRPLSVKGATVYTGVPNVNDLDGDGIPNASDNCVNAFNPIRPQDSGAQPDFDGDGEGDVCDVCPLNPNTSTCTPYDPADQDSDGSPNASDNCPTVFNPGQEDGDTDGKGDVCDACPAVSNPGGMACPATVYEIKQGLLPLGQAVSLQGVLVTARTSNGFFVQVKAGDATYAGAEHSGLFIFNSTPVDPGQRISIDLGIVASFDGQLQLSGVSGVNVLSSGEAPPAPNLATADELQTGGTRAAALEGVLVQVQDVTVTSVAPALGAGDSAPSNEFMVDGPSGATDTLRVDDLLFLISPFPTLGEQFASLSGVLTFRHGNSKLEPRSVADVVSASPGLLGMGPALTFTREGNLDSPTFPQLLTVQLSRTAQSSTFVSVASDLPGGLTVTGDGVTVAAGDSSATVLVSGVLPGTAVLTASLGATTRTAQVRVLGATEQASLASLLPDAAVVISGGSLEMTVVLDVPAPPGGATVALGVTGGGTVPATVTVPDDALSATFTFTDSGSGFGSTVTATLGGSDSSTVQIGDRRLVINEVDYDNNGTDNAEFVEIYNGTPAAVDLADLAVVFINGNGGSEYRRFSLASGGTLPAGGYLVVAPSTVAVAAGAIIVSAPGSDLIQNGSPDGVALVNTATLQVLDALSYEGTISAATFSGFTGTFNLVEGGQRTTAEDVTSGNGSLIRSPNGMDTDRANLDWSFSGTLTPGASNTP
ncbi:MAG: lamin tail domain-containing protein [Myxococcota bacterium]|nr:lamin tail domain-containing protein [Myxococcota bacterium]